MDAKLEHLIEDMQREMEAMREQLIDQDQRLGAVESALGQVRGGLRAEQEGRHDPKRGW